jgi:threonine dehydratase
LCEHLDGVITVTDQQMAEGCQLVAERMKVLVELSSGAAVAATLTQEVQEMEGERVGVILCGGNVDVREDLWLE